MHQVGHLPSVKLFLNFVPVTCLIFFYVSDSFRNSEKCGYLLYVHSVAYMLLDIRNVPKPKDFYI